MPGDSFRERPIPCPFFLPAPPSPQYWLNSEGLYFPDFNLIFEKHVLVPVSNLGSYSVAASHLYDSVFSSPKLESGYLQVGSFISNSCFDNEQSKTLKHK